MAADAAKGTHGVLASLHDPAGVSGKVEPSTYTTGGVHEAIGEKASGPVSDDDGG